MIPPFFDAEAALRKRGLTPDTSQKRAIAAFNHTLRQDRPHSASGLYCFGPPGRGKSLLAELFYEAVGCRRTRIHFHTFLRDVNAALVRAPKGLDDRLAYVLREWLQDVDLLWFDEFHVHDLADSFLLAGLVRYLIDREVVAILTSNYEPDKLLADPEFHERFEPTIGLLKTRFVIVPFDGTRDYREGQIAPRTSADARTEILALKTDDLRRIFVAFEGEVIQAATVKFTLRPLSVRAVGATTVWCNFEDLCVVQRSHFDYLELAARFSRILIDRVDESCFSNPHVLQRFIWLIDIIYDRRREVHITSGRDIVTALLSSKTAIPDIHRTVSRLAEMLGQR